MVPIDLTGKRAFVAGVADDGGFGFAIAKALAEAGASVCVGTWPPALGIFEALLERGKMAGSLELARGGTLNFERIYPLDAAYDTMDDVPEPVRENKRYRERGDFTIAGVVERFRTDFGELPLDIVVHSLANGPEVRKPLLDTSRRGYLEAIGVSAYSNVAFVRELGAIMRPGGCFLSLTYMASERVIPGYGGGMSTAKAALEADTRTLAFEAGRRFGVRVNTISAGPYASRAASAIGFIDTMIRYTTANSPLTREFEASDVGNAAAFLCSPLAAAITGSTVYVDNGYHAMGMAVTGLLAMARPDAPDPAVTARLAATLGAVFALIAVAAGAFGAHALRSRLEPRDLEIFETAVRYQMYHAFALFVASALLLRGVPHAGNGAWAFVAGITVFSGSLYLMVFTGTRWLGAITPLGGVAFLAGWTLIALAARKL